MITLQTLPTQIRRELDEDEKRANYWFVKQHHGERSYDRWRTEQCQRLLNSFEKELFSDPVEYISPNGNRWLAYEHTTRDGEGGCYTFCYCVMYYETIGSVGAYCRMELEDPDTKEMLPGCIHYTPHFFQRFAERLGLEFRSRTMMLRFLQLAHHHLIKEKNKREGYKDREIVMRFPGSYAFGSMRNVEGYNMVTVRTFLPTTMLTPTRKKELQEYGEFCDNVKDFIERERLRETSTEIHIPCLI